MSVVRRAVPRTALPIPWSERSSRTTVTPFLGKGMGEGAMNTRIAAVQMVSGPDIAQNLRDAGRLVAEAAARGARLVALPEYFPLISGNDTDKVLAREKEGTGPLQDFLRETAQRHKVWLVGGSIPLEASVPDKVRNSCLVFDDSRTARGALRQDPSVRLHARNRTLQRESDH